MKILDFGLARVRVAEVAPESRSSVPTQQMQTEPGMATGTLGYMSPDSRDLSDLYLVTGVK